MEVWRYRSAIFFISALDGGESSASYPGPFTPYPRDRAAGIHWIGDSESVCLKAVEKSLTLSVQRGYIMRTSVSQVDVKRPPASELVVTGSWKGDLSMEAAE
jgi:hypothetical protein